ncbi:MAG: hypothetical protein U0Q22_12710 [Acidimicrobiales bacterium]
MADFGPLTGADERLCHQIADTFATVSQSDLSWTEKVCAMASARDGSLQIGFGMGVYPNRDVLDGYAGVAIGNENRVVRATRRFAPAFEDTSVGPIRYEVTEPLHEVRFVLDANDAQPIAYDVTFSSIVPPRLEARDRSRSPSGARVAADLARYHQVGTARGWVEVDGRRTDIDPERWICTRDHSWGVRYHVGAPTPDVEPPYELDTIDGLQWRFGWSPAAMTTDDGRPYAIHHFFQELNAFGFEQRKLSGGIEWPDGRVEEFAALRPELRYDTESRKLLGGVLHFTMADGSARPIEIEPVGEAALHLGLGKYFGLDGAWHGQWRGELDVVGEHVPDVREPQLRRRLHQIRDLMMAYHDPVGGGTGVGNYQSTIAGAWPDLGLTQDTSFL